MFVREDVTGYPAVNGATATVESGSEFSVSGLDVEPEGDVLVVVELNAAAPRDVTGLRLEASFDEDGPLLPGLRPGTSHSA